MPNIQGKATALQTGHDGLFVSLDPAYDIRSWRPARVSYRPIAGLLLSPEDFEILGWPWWLDEWGYARRSVRVGVSRPTVYMHRLILTRIEGRPLSSDELCDHINRNPLDNRRENLRVATAQQNSENRSADQRNRAGGLRGASWHPKAGKWQATVRHNGKNQYLGLFSTPEEAAAVAARRRAQLGFADASPTSKELGNGISAAA